MKKRILLITLIILAALTLSFSSDWICLPDTNCHVLMSANAKGSSTTYILCYNDNGPQTPHFEDLGGGAARVECP